MIIDVKGTKSTPTNVDPAQDYALQDQDRLSSIPKILALAFVGIGLYLKSIFPTLGAAVEGKSLAGDAPLPSAPDKAVGVPEGQATASNVRQLPQKDGAVQDTDAAAAKMGTVVRLVKQGTAFEPKIVDTPVLVRAEFGSRTEPVMGASEILSLRPVANLPIKSPADVTPAPRQSVGPDSRDDVDNTHETPADSVRDRPKQNRAPRVESPVYLQDVIGLSVLLIVSPDLLRGATDPDGDPLRVTNLSVSSGQLTEEDGYWTYQATGEITEDIKISYTITDGTFEIAQTAHLTAIRPWIQGSPDDDLLVGTVWADDIHGGAGDDNIDGRDGNDVIYGADGNDHILGGAGNDTIFGGKGNDTILGQDGDDHLFGGEGDDILYGGNGNDVLFGEDGNDTLYGGPGDDFLSGGAGDDMLYDGPGSDTVHGGAGDDIVHADPDGSDDWFLGGEGHDTLDYSAATQGIVIDTTLGVASSDEIGTDRFEEFEHIIAGSGDDHFIVGASPVTLTGGAGDNVFEFVKTSIVRDQPLVVHQITDFKFGDKIKMSHYEIFEEIYDDFEDEFEELYGRIDDDDFAIRLRFDGFEDRRQTIIEADLNLDGIFETTVFTNGHLALVVVDLSA